MVNVYEVSGWDIGKADEHRDEKLDYVVMEKDYAKLEQKLSAMSQQLTDTVIENQKLRDLLEHVLSNASRPLTHELIEDITFTLEDE